MRRSGLQAGGAWGRVESPWGILRARHLWSRESGAWSQGGHPRHPACREGSHGCGAEPTCCVCFHSAEAAAATPLVVASRPRYIMSSAPQVARATRVTISSPVGSSSLARSCGPAQDPDAGAGRGRGCCCGLTGNREGGASSSGVPRWGSTCKKHTWSWYVRPAEGWLPPRPAEIWVKLG